MDTNQEERMNISPTVYAAARDALLAQIVTALSADDRFVAAWLTGSLGRNEQDDVSDIDLTVVVAEPHSQILCARSWQTGAKTTAERLALFQSFGPISLIHENNNNAPAGGTFTFTMYAASTMMVDWILRPYSTAQRPLQSRLLFEKATIPLEPPAVAERLDQQIERVSERVAFFWMMAAVVCKYIRRGDTVFVQCWLESLSNLEREVERLVAGQPWQYHHGTMAPVVSTLPDQIAAVRHLCQKMADIMPELAARGGTTPREPMAHLEYLLRLAES
ncbi:MAG: nucleotidyltransferase domain-containing protein [Chloroflexi bacterium]|nr:nucleotidyltransferase domain-containing protein [Chloroflexota bacterium]